MLLFSTNSITVDGVTVFPDHADKNQFWYLPGPVDLAKMPGSDEPQFLLIEYTPDVAATGVKGVGFLNVTVCLTLRDETRGRIMGQIQQFFPDADDPRIAPVPFDEGTVQIVALDMQGSGGAANTAAPGTFEAVEHILGAVTPELFGDNNAVFGLTLSEDGASILKAAFEGGMAPVGAIYTLKFTGVRPALDVKITADLKRVYDSFSIGVSAKAYWVTLGIDATFEKLRQDGAIKIEVVNLAGDQANADREKEALDLFKEQILSSWFTPTLSPQTAQAADAGAPTLPSSTTTTTTSGGGTKATTTTGTSATKTGTQTQGGMTGPTKSGGMTSPSTKTGTTSSAPNTAGGMQSAAGAGSMVSAPAPTGSIASPAAPANASQPAAAPAAAAGTSSGGAPPSTTTTSSGPGAGQQIADTAKSLAGAAQSAGSQFGLGVAFKLNHQDELKTVTYEYNRMDAVQRTYAPQGYFALLLGAIDKSKHFLQVDGTDDFFRKFSVAILPPHDYASIGLETAHVAIDYGDLAAPDTKHGEFVFDAAHAAATSWDIFEGQIHTTEYTYTADYTFDPSAGWAGAQNRVQLAPVTTENRQLTLDPYATLGFINVTITPGRIDPGVVDRVEIVVQYAGTDGWQTSDTFTVRADSQPQSWKVRTADKNQKTYSYTTKCVLKDGTVITTPAVTSPASGIVVHDAFAGGIDVLVQPAFDTTKTRAALIELDYADKPANYRYQNTLNLPPGNAQPIHLHIPVLNREQTGFAYRITTIGTDGAQHVGDLVDSQNPVVLVGDRP